MKDPTRTELTRSAHYRNLAGALRALVPKLKQPQSRGELQQLADDYERLAQFTQSVSASESHREASAEGRSRQHSVWLIVTHNSLDN